MIWEPYAVGWKFGAFPGVISRDTNMTSNLKASVMEDQDVWKHLSESAVSTAVKNDDYDDVIIQTIQKKKNTATNL